MQYGKKKKKKLKFGDWLSKNQQQLAGGSTLAGSMLDPLVPETSKTGQALSSGLQLAGAGMSIGGPVGAAIGGGIGLIKGVFDAKAAKEAEDEAKQQEQQAYNLSLIGNTTTSLRKGGELLSKKLGPTRGGKFGSLSDKAIMVKGDKPGTTDGIETPDAFLDHNEVVLKRPTDKVLSDSIYLNGKSVAQLGKKLEKARPDSDNPRFGERSPYSKFLDTKGDALFNYQEAVKQEEGTNTMKQSFRKGGKLKPSYQFGDPIDPTKKRFENEDEYAAFISGQPAKPITGFTPDLKNINLNNPISPINSSVDILNRVAPMGKSKTMQDIEKGSNTSKPYSYTTPLTQAATYGPNILNQFLTKKLKGPKGPILETKKKLKRLDPSSQLAESARQAGQVTELIKKNTGQASNLIAGTGSVLSKRFANENQIIGQFNNQNSQIQGNEAFMNQQVEARNAGRTNQFRDNQVEFANKKLQLTSENVANLSSKILAQGREKNQIQLDKDKYTQLMTVFKDLPNELQQRHLETFFNSKLQQEEKTGKKLGGKLKKRTKNKY